MPYITLRVHGLPKQGAVAEGLALGLLTGAYEATRFKSKPTTSALRSADLLLGAGGTEADAGIARGAALAKGVLLARCAARAAPAVPQLPLRIAWQASGAPACSRSMFLPMHGPTQGSHPQALVREECCVQ